MQEKLYIISADDDADDQDFLEFALGNFDCGELVFERVSNGEKLLQQLKRNIPEKINLPDLILLDLNMPVKNGKEVLLSLEADPVLKDIPVLVLTTSNAAQDKIFCLNHGASYFLVKPNSVSELATILAPALEKYCAKV